MAKIFLPGLLAAVTLVGCITTGSTANNRPSAATALNTGTSAPSPPTFPASSIDENKMPRIILPATGGAPIIGIPIGGNIFLPSTGGPPVIGIPTSP